MKWGFQTLRFCYEQRLKIGNLIATHALVARVRARRRRRLHAQEDLDGKAPTVGVEDAMTDVAE